MRRVYARMTEAGIDRLVRRALRERRHPADLAGLLLEEELLKGRPRGDRCGDGEAGREVADAPPAA